jgi:hypothetical protein
MDKYGYRHTLKISNSYSFFTSNMVTLRLLVVPLIRTLSALYVTPYGGRVIDYDVTALVDVAET